MNNQKYTEDKVTLKDYIAIFIAICKIVMPRILTLIIGVVITTYFIYRFL